MAPTALEQDVAQRVAGLGRALRPVGHGDASAGHHGGRDERRGVGQVRLDVQRRRRAAAPARPARRWVSASSTRTPRRAASRRSSRCAADGSAAPSWRTSMPLAKRGAASSSAGDELRRQRGVDLDGAAGEPAAPCTVNGSRPVAVVDDRAPRARSAVDDRFSGRSALGVAVEPHGAVGERGHRRQEAHHGAGHAAVDRGGPRERSGREPGRRPVVDGHPERPRSACDHQLRVAAAQRPRRIVGDDAMAASTSARFVTDLDPGTFTVARTGPAAVGAGHGKVMPGA